MGCWADCTEIKFMDKDGQNEVTDPSKITIEKLVVNGETEKKAANSDKKVPYGFVITISKEYLNDLSGKEKKHYKFPHYFKIKFETNIEDSGILGKIGDKMMNRNARLFVK